MNKKNTIEDLWIDEEKYIIDDNIKPPPFEEMIYHRRARRVD